MPFVFSGLIASPLSRIAAGLAVAAMATAVLVATPPPPALAADPTVTPTAAQSARAEERLERLLTREQHLLTHQQDRLDHSGEAIARTERFVADQKAQGKDPSAIESALAQFKAAVASARTHHDTAKALLDAHAGFDASGKVADQAQAKVTLRDAGRAQRLFHLTMRRGSVNLQTTVAEYRLLNRAERTATPAGQVR